MFRHPIVNLCFFLAFSFSVIFTFSGLGLSGHAIGFAILLLFNWKQGGALIRRLKPFLLFLPFMIILYIAFSVGFSERTLAETVQDAEFGLFKLTLLMATMTLFFVTTPSQDIVKVLRSIWLHTGLAWKWVDDFFLFLSITLRFYPAFQSNWKAVQATRKALGFSQSKNFMGKVKSATDDLPRLLLYHLRRSENVAAAMYFRGYGRHFPRPIIYPMEFRFGHLLEIIAICFSFIGIHWYGPL